MIGAMPNAEPADYQDFKETIAYEASHFDHGVYEVWWDANSRYPDWPLSQRLAIAERVVDDLIASYDVRFFRVNDLDRERPEPIAAADVPGVLRAWDTWVVPHDGNAIVLFRIAEPLMTTPQDPEVDSPT
jgi:hypothetical protein